MGLNPAAAARFNEEVVNRVGNVLLDKSGGTRLDLEVTEEMANARLAQMVAQEGIAGGGVPPVLRDLRVGFEPDEVVILSRLGRGLTGVVASQRLRLVAEADGRLRVVMAGTRAGSLPLPQSVMDYARHAVAQEAARQQAAGADDQTLALWRFLCDGIEGRPVPLGDRRKRILLDAIEIERGVLKIRGHRVQAGK
jgi:hypothetical protein